MIDARYQHRQAIQHKALDCLDKLHVLQPGSLRLGGKRPADKPASRCRKEKTSSNSILRLSLTCPYQASWHRVPCPSTLFLLINYSSLTLLSFACTLPFSHQVSRYCRVFDTDRAVLTNLHLGVHNLVDCVLIYLTHLILPQVSQ
jgi:hypothetical protein